MVSKVWAWLLHLWSFCIFHNYKLGHENACKISRNFGKKKETRHFLQRTNPWPHVSFFKKSAHFDVVFTALKNRKHEQCKPLLLLIYRKEHTRKLSALIQKLKSVKLGVLKHVQNITWTKSKMFLPWCRGDILQKFSAS